MSRWILSRRWRVLLLVGVLVLVLGILMGHPHKPAFPWYYVLGWLLLVFWVAGICLKASPQLFSPLLFCVYFLVGYPLKVIYGQFAPQLFASLEKGMYFFRRTAHLDFEIALAAAACVIGVGIGVKVLLFLKEERRARVSKYEPSVSVDQDKRPLAVAVFAFALLVPLLYTFMWRYDIGQTGVRPYPLPFRLAGIVVQVRAVFVPMVGIYLLWQCLRLQARRLLWFMCAILILETIACGFLTLSRATGMTRIIAYGLFVGKIYKQLPAKTLWRIAVGGACLVILQVVAIVPWVTTFRLYDWRGRPISAGLEAAFSGTLKSGNYQRNLDFVFCRTLGIEDLMGVAAYGNKNMTLMYEALITKRGTRMVNYRMFGLRRFASHQIGGKTFIGRGMSIISYLYLSGSYLVVFFCSAAVCFGLCLVELYLQRVSLPAGAVWVMVCVPTLWEGVLRSLFYALIIFTCSCLFLVKILDPWLTGRRVRKIRPRGIRGSAPGTGLWWQPNSRAWTGGRISRSAEDQC